MRETAALALSLFACVATAADGPNTVDRRFMTDAAADAMAEVALGRLAAEKASSDDVKSFGRRMVGDHGKAHAELASLAAAKGVELPADLRPEHKAAERTLRGLSGPDFDAAYMAHMASEHEKAVRLFTRQASSSADPELKAWAGRTLPALRRHLERARELHSSRPGRDAEAPTR